MTYPTLPFWPAFLFVGFVFGLPTMLVLFAVAFFVAFLHVKEVGLLAGSAAVVTAGLFGTWLFLYLSV